MTDRTAEVPQNLRVDALLEEMRGLCAEIDAIGLEQQKQLDEGELEAFVTTLHSRNPKIESLAKASMLVEGYLEADGVGIDQVISARKQLDEMSELIGMILKRDAEQQSLVEARRNEISKELTGVGAAKTAMRAYSGSPKQPAPTLQDRKG